MTLTTHGHHIPYTSRDDEPLLVHRIARCGGATICQRCAQESRPAFLAYKLAEMDDKPQFPEDTSEYSQDNDRFLSYAKQFVVGANAVETAETGGYELKIEDLYIVWFSKTLQNWKALISTSVPGDGLYFEVTHNGDKEETYVDIYSKVRNHVFSHHDH